MCKDEETIPGVAVIKSATPQCLFMEIVPCRETETFITFDFVSKEIFME